MTSKPLISIVIPTKNRQKYCLSAIDSILQIGSDKVQIVIQDNSDTDDLKNQMPKIENEQILKYQYIPEKLSFVENFNNAIESADGQYICIIGDDDGINPEILVATQWAKDNNIDALVGNINANYRWNDTGAPDTFFTKMTGSTLSILGFNGKAELVNIEDSFNQLMQNGCTNYLDFAFPKLYHGIVKMDVLNKIKTETGKYLKGLSPDIYSAISIACNIDKLILIDYPLTIPGVCGQSTSISEGQKKEHSKRLEDAPHFRDRGNYEWSVQVPRIYCVQTIWADSGFAALREMKRDDLIKKFNKYSLYAKILQADPSLVELLNEKIALDRTENTFNDQLFEKTRKEVKWNDLSIRGKRRLAIILKLKELKHITGLHDMHKAMNYLTNYLQSKNINIIQNLNKVNHK